MSMPGSDLHQHPAEGARHARPAIRPPSGERPGLARALRQALGRFRSDRRGAVAAEFALILPVFALLIAGMFDVGLAVHRQATLAHAAKETVRFAAVRGAASGREVDTATLEQWARDATGLDPAVTTATAAWSPDRTPGSTVSVALSHVYSPVTFLAFGSDLTLSADASMVITR